MEELKVVTDPALTIPNPLRSSIFIATNKVLGVVTLRSVADVQDIARYSLENFIPHITGLFNDHPSSTVHLGTQLELDKLARRTEGRKLYVCANLREFKKYSQDEERKLSSPYDIVCGSFLQQKSKNLIC